MSLLAKDVEETHGARLELRVLDAELWQAFLNESTHLASLRDTTQVTFHICHEAGDACLAEGLCYHLQGDGLTCTCGSRNQSVAVGHLTYDAQGTIVAVGNIQPSFLVVHTSCVFMISVSLRCAASLVLLA